MTRTSFAICRTFSFGALLSTVHAVSLFCVLLRFALFIFIESRFVSYRFNVVFDVNIIQNKLFAHMILMDDKKEVKFQLDSGATANLVRDSSAV
jgi:hypothetical protein